MPSYTSIINALLRILPRDKGTDALKSVSKLHPNAESFSDPSLSQLHLDEHARAWQTRHAYEACRGWKWPFWINAQLSPASASGIGQPFGPTLSNLRTRDAAAIPGIHGTFAGTIDRRGMVTPAGGRFSIEVWFRFGDEVIYPAELLSEESMSFDNSGSDVSVSIKTAAEEIRVCASAHGSEDFNFLQISATCEPLDDAEARPVTIYFGIRPYNLEGVAPLHDLVYNSKGFWMSESRIITWFANRPSESWASDARHGDAAFFLTHPPERTAVRCPAGLTTAISAFHLATETSGKRKVTAVVPLDPMIPRVFPFAELAERRHAASHTTLFEQAPLLQAITISGHEAGRLLTVGNAQLCSLVDIRSREMHNHFLHQNQWLVPAVRALLYQGHKEQAARLLTLPALSIQKNGYLELGGGKWAFQGQYLTALADYFRLTQSPANNALLGYPQIRAIARWIIRKRREVAHAPAKPTGLLPPGVTRSGTGMEYQLADNFWALEGLESAAYLARLFGEHTEADIFKKDAGRYAAQINGAIHRELEYGLSQQVPGRLHRAFDPANAAELLEIALLTEAHRLLRADDWLSRLIDYLIQPLRDGTAPEILPGVTLRQMDQHGVFPARRMMLCMAMISVGHDRLDELLAELPLLSTPFHVWTQSIDPSTRMGNGYAFVDPEATALFTVLIREMLLRDESNVLRIGPALPPGMLPEGLQVDMTNTQTMHGPVTVKLRQERDGLSLDFDSSISDHTVEIYWCQPEGPGTGTFPCNVVESIGSATSASGNHTYKFQQPSNNPTS